jgi:hypothetical protein
VRFPKVRGELPGVSTPFIWFWGTACSAAPALKLAYAGIRELDDLYRQSMFGL